MAACKVIVFLALAVAAVMAQPEDSARPKKQVFVGTAGYPYAYPAAAAVPAAYSAYSAPVVAQAAYPAAYPAYSAAVPAAVPAAYSAYSAPVVAPAAYSASYPAGYYGARPVVTIG